MSVQGVSDRIGEGEGTSKESNETVSPIRGGKRMMEKISKTFHTLGFWFFVFALCGFLLGSYSMHWFQQRQLDEAIFIGAFAKDKKIYELKQRL